MKVIIAGSRYLKDPKVVALAMASAYYFPTEVCCGTPWTNRSAPPLGADQLGEQWAELHRIPVRHFPADWDQHGRAAGPIRNRQMACYADALVACWDGRSRGTRNMIEEATDLGLKISIFRI